MPESIQEQTGVEPIVVDPAPAPDAPGGGTEQPRDGAGQFTQADLDRLIPERAKRMTAAMLRELGYESADDLKAALAKAKELERAQMSELEKAQQATEDAKLAAQKAAEERDHALETARDTQIRAAVMAAAAGANAAHPEDAYYLADLGLISIGDDGRVVGADKAVEALVEAGRIPLRGRPQAPPLDGGAGSGEREPRTPALSEEELRVAKQLGVSPEDYAKQKQAH